MAASPVVPTVQSPAVRSDRARPEEAAGDAGVGVVDARIVRKFWAVEVRSLKMTLRSSPLRRFLPL